MRIWWCSFLWNWGFILEKTTCKPPAGSGDGLCQACTYLGEMDVKLQAARLGESSCAILVSIPIVFQVSYHKALAPEGLWLQEDFFSHSKENEEKPVNAKLSCAGVFKKPRHFIQVDLQRFRNQKKRREQTVSIVSSPSWVSGVQFFVCAGKLGSFHLI